MPRLPFQQAEGVPQPVRAVPAERRSSADRTRALAQFGGALVDLGAQLNRAKQERDIQRGQVEVLKSLGELRLNAAQSTDPDEMTATHQTGLESAKTQILDQFQDGEVRDALGIFFDKRAVMESLAVQESSLKLSLNQGLAAYTENKDQLIRAGAAEETDEGRALVKDQFEEAVSGAVSGQIVDPSRGATDLVSGLDQIDENSVRQDINRDPSLTIVRLEAVREEGGPAFYRNLDPQKREQFIAAAREAERRLERQAEQALKNQNKRNAEIVTDLKASNKRYALENGTPLPGFEIQMGAANATPEETARAQQETQLWARGHTALAEIRLAPLNEWGSIVAGLEPTAADGDLFAEKQRVQAVVQQEVSNLQVILRRDPAAFIDAVAPPPSQADGSPLSFEQRIDHRLREYRVRGVPLTQQKPLSGAETAQIVGNYNGAGTDGKLIAARQIFGGEGKPGMFGERDAEAIQQLLEDGLPQSANIIAALPASRADVAKIITDIEDDKESTLRARLDAGMVRDIEEEVGELFEDEFARSLPDNFGQASALRNEIEKLAFAYAIEKRQNPGQQAYADIVGKYYTFLKFGNQDRQLRVPISLQGVPTQRIERTATLVMSRVNDFNPIRGGIPEDVYRTTVETQGYWLTNKREDGAILHLEGQPVIDRSGKPITFMFAEAQRTLIGNEIVDAAQAALEAGPRDVEELERLQREVLLPRRAPAGSTGREITEFNRQENRRRQKALELILKETVRLSKRSRRRKVPKRAIGEGL